MTNKDRKRKTILGVFTPIVSTGIIALSKGKMGTGVALIAIATGLLVLYQHLDEKAKSEPRLPEGVDAELLTRLGKQAGQEAEERINEYREKNDDEK